MHIHVQIFFDIWPVSQIRPGMRVESYLLAKTIASGCITEEYDAIYSVGLMQANSDIVGALIE